MSSRLTALKKYMKSYFIYDEWVLAAYRDKINYRSFQDYAERLRPLTNRIKDKIIARHRDDILHAIKNKNPENYKAKTNIYLFSMACVLAISAASGFLISSYAVAHMGLVGMAAEAVSFFIYTTSYLANRIMFRKSNPSVLGKLLYRGKDTGWHFLSRQDVRIYQESNGCVETGYYNANKKYYEKNPSESVKFSWKQKAVLFVSFGCILVASAAAAVMSVTKVPGSMENFSMLTALQLGGAFTPIGWILAAATFFCIMASLTYAIIRVLDQKDKTQDLKGIFRSAKGLEGSARAEVYLYNFFMLLTTLGLMALAVWGVYNTSLVQSENLMKFLGASSNMAGVMTVAVVTLAAKIWFSIRSTANFVKILPLALTAGAMWMVTKCQNGVERIRNSNPFLLNDPKYKALEMDVLDSKGDDVINAAQGAIVSVNAASNGFMAHDMPGEGESSALFSGTESSLLTAWAASMGAAATSLASATDKFKPKEDKPSLTPDEEYCETRTSPSNSPAAYPAFN